MSQIFKTNINHMIAIAIYIIEKKKTFTKICKLFYFKIKKINNKKKVKLHFVSKIIFLNFTSPQPPPP